VKSFKFPLLARLPFVCGCLVALFGADARALAPDQLLLIVNKNTPAGMELATFYTKARGVPDGRILALDLPEKEDLSFDEYETKVVPAIRSYLRAHDLQNQVRCLVTFYGTPLRINGKTTSKQERDELADLRKQLDAARKQLPPIVAGLEKLGAEVTPAFKPEQGEALDQIGRRADAALRAVAEGLRRMPPPQQEPVIARLAKLVLDFTGPAKIAEMFTARLPQGFEPPGNDPRWRTRVAKARDRVEELQERRYDAAARAELRTVMGETFGPFSLAHVLQAQVDYLDNDGTAAALDSELSLLWWSYYPRSKWQVNPLNYHLKNARSNPVLMTMRLDAPTDALVREMIVNSLAVERNGLHGKFVIDSRGIVAKGPNDKDAGYAVYDDTLRRLSDLIRTRTKMQLVHDDRPEVLPPKSADDVALYCGWYSLRRYVPSCDFNPGAVAFHIASLEMVSLHQTGESGWAAGLLRSNVAATLGAVAEPYLGAFPAADDFFPLLLTGELPLAEVYWRTNPMASWMINMVGDPLYTPFKANPQMKAQDLPPRLRDALAPMPSFDLPATRPAPTSAPTSTRSRQTREPA
jgi:uncharacterized protein (TIGR03790 family)